MQPLKPGDTVGPFVIERRLGAGGMGVVYLGRRADGQQAAVKVVRGDLIDIDPSSRARFEQEMKVIERVGGHWTPLLLGRDAEAPRPWYATQYIDAPTLHDLVVRDGVLDLDRAVSLGRSLAMALTVVHGVDLVHRDLKPSNVLMAADRPRLIDFGIALDLDGGRHLTSTGVAPPGTVGYLSPEQMKGRRATPASDVFALGALLVFATSGHLPFPGDTNVAVFHRMGAPPDLTGVPGQLHALLRRCLAIDPAARPDPTELQRALGRPARWGTTLVAPDPPEPTSRSKQGGRRVPDPDGLNGGRRAGGPDLQPGAVVCAFVAVGLLAVECYWFYQLTHVAPANQIVWPAWLAGPLAFIGWVFWVLGVLMIAWFVLMGSAAVALVLQAEKDRKNDEVWSVVLAATCSVWGVGAAVLATQRTQFRWWADLLVGLAVFAIILFVSASVVLGAERRWNRPAFVTTALAQVDAAVLAGLLIWGLGRPVWLAVGLAGVGWVGLAVGLAVLNSFPSGRRPSYAPSRT